MIHRTASSLIFYLSMQYFSSNYRIFDKLERNHSFMRTAGYLLFIGVMLLTGSCVDIPKYDPAPAIEFIGIDKFDSQDRLGNPIKLVRITLSFEDGDGDLGENIQSEERRQYLLDNGGWGNYQVKVFRFINEKWEQLEMDAINYLAFPYLKTDGVRGPIRGKLDYDIDFALGPGQKDTPLKFVVKIRDRQLRESNIVETDSLSVPIFDEF